MRLSELLTRVDSRWHQEFVRFIDSGEASEEFLVELDGNESLQGVVEEAFAAQATALREFARWVKDDASEEASASPAPAYEAERHNLQNALTRVSELPPEQRRKVAIRAAEAAAEVHQHEVAAVVHDMESTLSAGRA